MTIEIAERIGREVDRRCGANATFEERERTAAAVGAEILAELARIGRRPAEPGEEG
jgi:hypothetical protein